jgi:hypothetical protein
MTQLAFNKLMLSIFHLLCFGLLGHLLVYSQQYKQAMCIGEINITPNMRTNCVIMFYVSSRDRRFVNH